VTTFTVEVESDYIRMGDSRGPTPSHRLNAYCTVIVRVSYGYGSAMGSNFRRGSGTGTGSIIGYRYGSGR